MIAIRGYYYDGRSSTQVPARCCISASGAARVEGLEDGRLLLSLEKFTIRVSPRLADTPRYLHLPNDAKFETEDNDGVDILLHRFQRRPRLPMVHFLESRKRWLLPCLFAVVLLTWMLGRYGIPVAAKVLAAHMPKKVTEKISQRTLAALDRSCLRESRLDPARIERLQKHFRGFIAEHREHDIQVCFRAVKGGGANAFALPNGTIVLTDEMVRLSAHDDELLSVIAHEIGHVIHRHGLRTLIQNSSFTFALLAITGDLSGTSELFLGLPILFTELAYSRGFEREADDFALSYLEKRGVAPVHFANLMRRIEQQRTTAAATASGNKGPGPAAQIGWQDFLSTHPSPRERLQQFDP
jgi:Zn-dependent protease with chaperone function